MIGTLTSSYISHPGSRNACFYDISKQETIVYTMPRNKKHLQSRLLSKKHPESSDRSPSSTPKKTPSSHLFVLCASPVRCLTLNLSPTTAPKTPSMQPPTHLTHPFPGHARLDTPTISISVPYRPNRRILSHSLIHSQRISSCTAPNTKIFNLKHLHLRFAKFIL